MKSLELLKIILTFTTFSILTEYRISQIQQEIDVFEFNNISQKCLPGMKYQRFSRMSGIVCLEDVFEKCYSTQKRRLSIED